MRKIGIVKSRADQRIYYHAGAFYILGEPAVGVGIIPQQGDLLDGLSSDQGWSWGLQRLWGLDSRPWRESGFFEVCEGY